MSEKKPLADELLREILVEQFREVYEDCTIGYSAYNLVIDFDSTADAERFVGLKGGVGIIVHDRIVLLDLYRLAAMGRKWARSQGYAIDIIALYRYEEASYIKVNHVEDSKRYNELRFDFNKEHTELPATFAAISAVWERVK